jgi:hypothetical protein
VIRSTVAQKAVPIKTCRVCGGIFGPRWSARTDRQRIEYRLTDFSTQEHCSRQCAAVTKRRNGGLKRSPTTEEVAYAAGLWEGEGTIHCEKVSRMGRPKPQMLLIVGMTDREPLERFREIWGVGQIQGPIIDHRRPDKAKPMWRYAVGAALTVADITEAMRPWLSPRRIRQVDDALRRYGEL